MKDIIICDLDGTVSQIGDRLSFIQSEKKDWDAFYDAVGTDKPIEPICRLVRTLLSSYGVYVLYITGRSDRVMHKSKAWLMRNQMWMDAKCDLLMRKEGDHRHDLIVKKELLDAWLVKKHHKYEDIWFALEDRNAVVSMWRTFGITCLQTQDGNF